MFYDPMIAKLITWGETRDEAADLQVQGLDAFRIEGPGHNLHFLSALMQHSRFRSGELDTGFIAEEWPEGFHGAAASAGLLRALAAIAGTVATLDADRARRIAGQLNGRPAAPGDWVVRLHNRDYAVTLGEDEITVDGEPIDIGFEYTPGDRMLFTEWNGEPLTIQLAPVRMGYVLAARGASHRVRVLNARYAHLARHMLEKEPPDLSKFLVSPMPGLLTALHVEQGDQVEFGQSLATIEAMKMENILRAGKAGRVKSLAAKQGDSLAVDQVILELE
jgi:propionyl-CoA carboxylase alpha chain